MIYAGYLKVATWKPQTGQVKFKISPGTGETKVSPGEAKKSTGSGFTGSVTEGCFNFLFLVAFRSCRKILSFWNHSYF